MKATALEFRLRIWVMTAIIVLGFWSPWIELVHIGTRTTTWLWLGFELGALGISATAAIQLVTLLTIATAAAATAIRVWGTAYLGVGTVNHSKMQAGAETAAPNVLADGPYRFVRNPLYIGSWLVFAAIAILMPPTGAAFSLVLISIFLFRLILGEESFLTATLGEPYIAYRKAVPRLFPALRSNVTPGGQTPAWGRALLAEAFPLCTTLSFAILSWQYNAVLLTRAVLVSFGISLVVRALLPSKPEQPAA